MGVCAGSWDQDGPAYARGQHRPPKTNPQEQHPETVPRRPQHVLDLQLGTSLSPQAFKARGQNLDLKEIKDLFIRQLLSGS